MEWWFATLGIVCLSLAAVTLRSTLLSFVTLTLFMPLALSTLHNDFRHFWILMALSFVVEIVALARHAAALFRRDSGRIAYDDRDGPLVKPSLA